MSYHCFGQAHAANMPVYHVNVPGGGIQQPATIPPNQKIFSSYTGNFVGYGGVPYGTLSDAPPGHSNYGKPFHVVVIDGQGNYMTHSQKCKR